MNVVKSKLKSFEEYASNPFLDKNKGEIMDIDFVISLSKTSMQIVRYLIKKNAYTDDKFIIDIDELNETSGYKIGSIPVRGFSELCSKHLLARTSIPFVFWINKNMLNSGMFCNRNSLDAKES